MRNVIIRHVKVVANLFTHCGQKGLKNIEKIRLSQR